MSVSAGKPVYDGLTTYVAGVDEAERIRQSLYRVDDSALAPKLAAVPERLSEADLAFFRANGYLAIEGLLSADEVAVAKAALSDLIAHRERYGDGLGIQEEPYYQDGGTTAVGDDPELRVRKLWKFAKSERRLGELTRHPKLVALLDQLIGPGHRMIQDMALLKPPYAGAEKPWHQDNAYFDYTPLDGIVGAWIAVDRATVENGCMQVIPGTHLDGPAPHYHVRDCQLNDERVEVPRALVVPLAPGGVLLFSGLLHHGTPPNRSADRRRALQFHYAAAHCQKLSIREHAELFDDGGAYAGCRDWDLEAGMSRARVEA
ncbi:MAG: phytanoyl-CoA dioxygenase family protein [Chloroflexota bacterium]